VKQLLLLASATCAACFLLGGCPSGAGGGAGSGQRVVTAQDPDRTAALDPTRLPPKDSDIVPTESEPESTYCCGNSLYKLEIVCEAGLMRCYERRDGAWHYTYGRHCKKNLGQVCYLSGCDDKCE